jgi:hypothetical protein
MTSVLGRNYFSNLRTLPELGMGCGRGVTLAAGNRATSRRSNEMHFSHSTPLSLVASRGIFCDAFVAGASSNESAVLERWWSRMLRTNTGGCHMPRISIPKKYLNQFVDQGAMIRALGNDKGTIKADLRAIRTVIQTKLADKAFLEKFANDVISNSAQIRVRL